MIDKKHLFNYNWSLKNTNFTNDKGKVFSCFSCGGGSTMGYKLAGFDVIGCNEIDPKMMDVYKENHNPAFTYLESIEKFKLRTDIPPQLYELDILDGSPPCSSFSMVGNREKDWGKEKVFREGQSKQVLDTLFFDFIDLANKLQPKVVIAENVKGLLLGEAKQYVIKIYEEFEKAGYYVQHFLLNASKMGVPQKRERVFFIALRKDLADKFLYQKDLFTITPKIELTFNEEDITFSQVFESETIPENKLSKKIAEIWEHRSLGDLDMSCTNDRVFNKPNSLFSFNYLYKDKVANTITAHDCNVLFDEPRFLSRKEFIKIGSFPDDYNFKNIKTQYLIGMSVPPIMTAQVATRVYEQWLKHL